MAELVDALDLGSSSRKGVGVRFPSLAPKKGERTMAQINQILQVNIDQQHPHVCKATVIIPESFVNVLYHQASLAHRGIVHTYGFAKGNTPLSYVEKNYRSSILVHVKEFLFKYFVIGFLYEQLSHQKIVIAGEPRLLDIILEPNQAAEFQFELSLGPKINLKSWKNIVFKSPKRKNYKDIDRQVETFIKDEHAIMKKLTTNYVRIGDWVCFDIHLLTEDAVAPFDNYRENLWIHIGNEEADEPFQTLFLGKKKNETFCTKQQCIQEYFSTSIATNYNFCIEIKDIVHNSFFSLDHLKHHFRLKTNKELQQKLIEVFSYRNDLSLRRAIVEEALTMLINKHEFDVPNYLILREQQIVLESVLTNPDYHVYKTQPNFKDYIHKLAVKQAKETLIIDQLAYEENLLVSTEDIKSLLHLTKAPRTKEFIYFKLPLTKLEAQEVPVASAFFKQSCLREKTLNHVIYHWTKR